MGRLIENLQVLSENKHATNSELADEWIFKDKGIRDSGDKENRCVCSRPIKSWWMFVNCINGHHAKLGSGCKGYLLHECKKFGEEKVRNATLTKLFVNSQYEIIDDLYQYTQCVMLDYYKNRPIADIRIALHNLHNVTLLRELNQLLDKRQLFDQRLSDRRTRIRKVEDVPKSPLSHQANKMRPGPDCNEWPLCHHHYVGLWQHPNTEYINYSIAERG